MKILFLINDPPYGTEKMYNALRLAMALQKDPSHPEILIFLMADAVTAAMNGQNTPQGYYNIARMLNGILSKSGRVRLCGTCVDARGLREARLVEGVEVSSMAELAEWTIQAEKVLVF
jgi:uncharacterized protein involved in oxidation of intracellular sulfur